MKKKLAGINVLYPTPTTGFNPLKWMTGEGKCGSN
jgi:hypothetical protein